MNCSALKQIFPNSNCLQYIKNRNLSKQVKFQQDYPFFFLLFSLQHLYNSQKLLQIRIYKNSKQQIITVKFENKRVQQYHNKFGASAQQMLNADSRTHNSQVTFRTQNIKTDIDEQLKQWQCLIDDTIAGQVRKIQQQEIENIFSKQMITFSRQIQVDVGDIVAYLLAQYNQMYEHYQMLIAQKDKQNQYFQNQMQQRLLICQKQWTKKIEMVSQLHKKQENKQNQKIGALQKQIKRRANNEEQYVSKLSKLQSQIQKYQYQLQQKCTIINSYERQIEEAIYQSQKLKKQMQQQSKQLYSVFQMQVWYQSSQREILEHQLQKEKQLITTINNLYEKSMINKNQQRTGTISETESPIKQLDDQQLYQQNSQQYLKQLKQVYEDIEDKVGKLVNNKRHQSSKYQALSHKYTQFLRETQNAMQELKTRIKQTEKQRNQLKSTNQTLSLNLSNKQQECIDLLQKLQNTLQQYNNSKTKNHQKISSLQSQLQISQHKLKTMQQCQKHQKQNKNKHIQLLTLQVQSLKQSISTLKNVIHVKNNNEQKQECIQAAVMQQMIDKTYEIRLENVRYKDIVEGMKMENMGLLGKIEEIQKTNRDLRSLCEENEEKLKICEGKQKQFCREIMQIRLMYESELQQKQRIAQKLSQSRNTLQALSKQKDILLQQIQQLQSETIQQKHKFLQKLQQITSQKQNLIEQHTKLSEQNKLQTLKLQKQYQQCITQQIQKQKYNYSISTQCYERIEIQQIQIHVLSEITKQYKQKIKEVVQQQKQVQVEINEYQFEQEKSQETLRNYKNCGKIRNKNQKQSIGKLVNVTKPVNNQLSPHKQNQPQQCLSPLTNLNKTCKIRAPSEVAQSVPRAIDQSQQIGQQVQELNDIINYMINYLKGYTRNGIRRSSWLQSQGQQYLAKIQSSKNMRQKYTNFEKVRSIMSKNLVCKQLVRDYEHIAQFYFKYLDQGIQPEISIWSSVEKFGDRQCEPSTHNRTQVFHKDNRLFTK